MRFTTGAHHDLRRTVGPRIKIREGAGKGYGIFRRLVCYPGLRNEFGRAALLIDIDLVVVCGCQTIRQQRGGVPAGLEEDGSLLRCRVQRWPKCSIQRRLLDACNGDLLLARKLWELQSRCRQGQERRLLRHKGRNPARLCLVPFESRQSYP